MAMALRLPCDEHDEAHAGPQSIYIRELSGWPIRPPVTDYPIANPPHGNAFGKNSCATHRGQENVRIQFPIAVRGDRAGVRKPPRKETASRKGVAAAATYRDLRVAGVCCGAVGMTIKDDFEG